MSNTNWWEMPDDESDPPKVSEPEKPPKKVKLCEKCVCTTTDTFSKNPSKVYCVWLGKEIWSSSEAEDHHCEEWRNESYFKKKLCSG